MRVKSRFRTLVTVLLSSVLAAWLPTAPALASWVEIEIPVETNSPVDPGEETATDEVTLPESSYSVRQARRQMFGRASNRAGRKVPGAGFASRQRSQLLGGQGSRWGRCGPMHC